MGNASQSAALSLFLLSETRKNKRVFVFEARKRHGTTTTHLDILILTHTSPTCRRDITEHRRQKHNDRQATQVIQCRHCKARTHGNHTQTSHSVTVVTHRRATKGKRATHDEKHLTQVWTCHAAYRATTQHKRVPGTPRNHNTGRQQHNDRQSCSKVVALSRAPTNIVLYPGGRSAPLSTKARHTTQNKGQNES
mgnify:CR=1 FL=1